MSESDILQAPSTTSCPELFELSKLGNSRLQVVFDEPMLSSDGGALITREVALHNGIIKAMTGAIRDERNQAHVQHVLEDLLAQRVIQICHGYEDANDCDQLKTDPAIMAALGRRPDGDPLASQPTMTRLENSITQRDLIRLFYVFIDHFLDSYSVAPECLILDLDPTAHLTYGGQQLALFNGHIDHHCLMPFHLYEGNSGRLITTILRPGKTPTDVEILALLKRVVKRIRARFPQTMLIFRADSHHTKPAVLDWLEANQVRYVLGLATNSVLRNQVAPLMEWAEHIQYDERHTCRRFHSFHYSAGTWSKERRVVARVEATYLGVDARFIVTDFDGASAQYLYDNLYCDRGNAELMIKEHKVYLKSSRTSCTSALANQFRLLLHSAAYVILHGMRDTLLRGTKLATATFATIQLRLLKVAVRVEVGKTFVRMHLPVSSTAAFAIKRLAAMLPAIRSG